jgi:N utilization substance protein A
MRALGLSQSKAETLVDNGYTTVEEVAYVPQAELLSESGLPTPEALALRTLARDLLLRGASGTS